MWVEKILHPGEEMSVRIIQDGKEPGQGVGYLDDGTMVVVDGGRGLRRRPPRRCCRTGRSW